MSQESIRTGTSHTAYGFGGRLTAGFPSQVVVDVTEVCNLACIHCPHPEFKKSPLYAARYLDPMLNKKMVDEVREFGQGRTRYIRYTSEGEPLVHPKGYEMIEYAVRSSGVFVTLTTNGTIMNEARTQRLLESGVHLIDISIDALSPEIYSKVRVGGDLEVTRSNVQHLLRWVRQTAATTKVVVSFVEQPENSHEAIEFESYWKGQGADYVIVRRLHSAAGAVQKIVPLVRRRVPEADRYPCLYPWERIILNPRGELAFCPQDWTHSSSIADFRKQSIREVWGGEWYRGLRDAHLRNTFAGHAFCGQCPDWRSTRWPGQGRSYADMIEEFTSSG